MEFANYQLDWPRENLSVRCFVHDVFNYRYHWHEDEYELNILLHGRQECCRGSENFHLDVDDVILVPPGVGHASMGSQVDTIAFVLHFSASAFKPLLKKGGIYDFPSCRSDETTRDEPRYRHLRFYASQIFQCLPSRAGPTPSRGSKPVWSCCSLPFAPSSPLPCSIPCPRMNNAGLPSAACWPTSPTTTPKN